MLGNLEKNKNYYLVVLFCWVGGMAPTGLCLEMGDFIFVVVQVVV